MALFIKALSFSIASVSPRVPLSSSLWYVQIVDNWNIFCLSVMYQILSNWIIFGPFSLDFVLCVRVNSLYVRDKTPLLTLESVKFYIFKLECDTTTIGFMIIMNNLVRIYLTYSILEAHWHAPAVWITYCVHFFIDFFFHDQNLLSVSDVRWNLR